MSLVCTSSCPAFHIELALLSSLNTCFLFGKLFLLLLITHTWPQTRFYCGSIGGCLSSAIHNLPISSNGPFPSSHCCHVFLALLTVAIRLAIHLVTCRVSHFAGCPLFQVTAYSNNLKIKYKEVRADRALLPPYVLALNIAGKNK